jgi:hypothetical protein
MGREDAWRRSDMWGPPASEPEKKEIDRLTEQAKNNEIIIVFVLNCATLDLALGPTCQKAR